MKTVFIQNKLGRALNIKAFVDKKKNNNNKNNEYRNIQFFGKGNYWKNSKEKNYTTTMNEYNKIIYNMKTTLQKFLKEKLSQDYIIII